MQLGAGPAPRVIAFSNCFGGDYEGGPNWQQSTLLALGTLPDPPLCLIVGAKPDQLPDTVRSAPHVRAVAVEDDPLWRAALEGPDPTAARHRGYEAIGREHGVDLWVGWHDFRGVGADQDLVVVWPDFHARNMVDRFPDLTLVIRAEQSWRDVVRRARAIVAISHATAADALDGTPEVAERLHVACFTPVITPERVRLDPDAVRREFHLPERFLIVGNQFWGHKNHIAVVEALALLRRRGAEVPTVVFTGRVWGSGVAEHFERVLRAAHRGDVHGECRFLGHLPREQQFALLRAARATVQPSHAEGRGAILEESLIVGTPVICSDLAVHHEQAPAGTPFFDPDDHEALAEALLTDLPKQARTVAEILEDAQARRVAYGREFFAACASAISRDRASAPTG